MGGGAQGAGAELMPAVRGRHGLRLGWAVGKRVLPRLKNFKYAGKSGPRAPPSRPPRLRSNALGLLGPNWGYGAQTGGSTAPAQRGGKSACGGMAGLGTWGQRDRGT